jgi:hypothetical protein
VWGSALGWVGQCFAWLLWGVALLGLALVIFGTFVGGLVCGMAWLGWAGLPVGMMVPIVWFGCSDGFTWRKKRPVGGS